MSSPPAGRIAIGNARLFATVGISAEILSPTHGGTPSSEGYSVTGAAINGYTDRWGRPYAPSLAGYKVQIDTTHVLAGHDALKLGAGTSGLGWLSAASGGPSGTGDGYLCMVGRPTAANTNGAGFDTMSFWGVLDGQVVGIGTTNAGALNSGPQSSAQIQATQQLITAYGTC